MVSWSHVYIMLELNALIVDRILKKQRAEREAVEQARREQAKEAEKLVSDVAPEMPQHDAPPIASASTKIVDDQQSKPAPLPPTSVSGEGNLRRPASLFSDRLQNWGRKLVPTREQAKGSASDGNPTRAHSPEGEGLLPSRSGSSRARSPQPVTPQGNIGKSI